MLHTKISFKHSFIAVSVATLIAISSSAFASDLDNTIESSFKKSFVYKTYLKDENIKITSKDGVVVLSGEVFDDAHKPMAESTAEALVGVRSVDNKIVVREDRLPENSDTWIRMKVQTALVFHSSTSAIRTSVTTKDGVVTVSGKAQNSAEIDLVTKLVEDVDGVYTVVNTMSVDKSLKN